MIKTVYEKWVDIEKNVDVGNENQIFHFYLSKKTMTNIYFGILHGEKVIYLEFDSKVLSLYEPEDLTGMEISVCDAEFINPSKKYILIKNVSKNPEIFMAFVSSLCDELVSTETYDDAFNTLSKVIKSYRDFFANPNKSLSLNEEQGLCAELIELKNVINIYGEKSVFAWQGPKRNKRDFVFDDFAVEVKSTSSQINSNIKISNENQLDASYPEDLKKLFLKVFVMENVDTGINVISCANEVLDMMKDITCKNFVKANLLRVGVDTKLFKPRYQFSVESERYYLVDDDFPKLTKKNISDKIFDVEYKIHVDMLSNYVVNKDVVYE